MRNPTKRKAWFQIKGDWFKIIFSNLQRIKLIWTQLRLSLFHIKCLHTFILFFFLLEWWEEKEKHVLYYFSALCTIFVEHFLFHLLHSKLRWFWQNFVIFTYVGWGWKNESRVSEYGNATALRYTVHTYDGRLLLEFSTRST